MRFSSFRVGVVAFAALASMSYAPHAVFAAPLAPCAASDRENVFQCPQRDRDVVRMFVAARARNVAAVKASVPKATDSVDKRETAMGKALALALADARTYTKPYLALFERAGFAELHYLDNISAAGLTSPNAAFDIITHRAALGDGMAYAAMLSSVAPISEFHAPLDPRYVARHPERMFAAMKAAGPEVAAAYLCTEEDEGRDPGYPAREVAVLKHRAGSAAGRALVAKLETLIETCSRYDANL